VPEEPATFYEAGLATSHHEHFGDIAESAAALLEGLLRQAGTTSGTVVDLGCGTGILARLMTRAGYDVVGFDLSPDMLARARAEAPQATFHQASAFDADIPACVAVTATGEVLNYAADPRASLGAVEALVGRVAAAMEPGGILLFDVSTPGRAGPLRHQERFVDHPGWTLGSIVEETAPGGSPTLTRDITLFRRSEDGRYARSDEHHVLALYEPDQVGGLLEAAGFEVVRRPSYAATATRSTPPAGWTVFVARLRDATPR